MDVELSKCLHATSSNALFYMHYVGNVNYRSLITVMFPIGSMRELSQFDHGDVSYRFNA